MKASPPLRDRLAFALLVPSLAVPIAAMVSAAWRSTHADDGRIVFELGLGPLVFAVAVVLSVAFSSAVLNAIQLLRRQSSFELRALRPRRAAFHYLETAVLLLASVYFGFDRTGAAGLLLPPVVIGLAITSFIFALKEPRVVPEPVTAFPMTAGVRVLLAGYGSLLVGALALLVYSIGSGSELVYLAAGLIIFLGLPWSAASTLLWLPVGVVAYLVAPGFAPISVVLLAAIPLIYNVVLAIMFVSSERARVEFVNKLYGVRGNLLQTVA